MIVSVSAKRADVGAGYQFYNNVVATIYFTVGTTILLIIIWCTRTGGACKCPDNRERRTVDVCAYRDRGPPFPTIFSIKNISIMCAHVFFSVSFLRVDRYLIFFSYSFLPSLGSRPGFPKQHVNYSVPSIRNVYLSTIVHADRSWPYPPLPFTRRSKALGISRCCCCYYRLASTYRENLEKRGGEGVKRP